jgi:uncharacterized protein YjbI with pentapeptide repeats
MKLMFSKELVDAVKAGQKEFDDINVEYADISGVDFSNIVIKNSRLWFVNFRNCDMRNARFINCEIFWGGFYSTNNENGYFEKCKIDFTWMERAVFRNTKMRNSSLSWTAILECALGELDMSSTTTFKLFTDISQLGPNDLDEAMRLLGPIMDKMDLSIKNIVMAGFKSDVARYGIDMPTPVETRSAYGVQSSGQAADQGYGFSMADLSTAIINAYNANNPYKAKRDDPQSGYR